MDVVNKPVIATRAAAAGLMDAELRIGVQCSGRQRGHELEVGGLRSATAERLEHGPSTRSGLVLELEVLTAVGRFAAARATFVDPSMERHVCTPCEVDGRRGPVRRASVGSQRASRGTVVSTSR